MQILPYNSDFLRNITISRTFQSPYYAYTHSTFKEANSISTSSFGLKLPFPFLLKIEIQLLGENNRFIFTFV